MLGGAGEAVRDLDIMALFLASTLARRLDSSVLDGARARAEAFSPPGGA